MNERGFGMDVGKSEVNGEFGEFIGGKLWGVSRMVEEINRRDDNFIVSEKIS